MVFHSVMVLHIYKSSCRVFHKVLSSPTRLLCLINAFILHSIQLHLNGKEEREGGEIGSSAACEADDTHRGLLAGWLDGLGDWVEVSARCWVYQHMPGCRGTTPCV